MSEDDDFDGCFGMLLVALALVVCGFAGCQCHVNVNLSHQPTTAQPEVGGK